MSDTKGVSDDPMENETSSVDGVKEAEEKDKDNTEKMDVDEEPDEQKSASQETMETAEASEEKREDLEKPVAEVKDDDSSSETKEDEPSEDDPELADAKEDEDSAKDMEQDDPSEENTEKEEKTAGNKGKAVNGQLKRRNEKSPKRIPKVDGKENKEDEQLTRREHILDHLDFKRDASNRVKLYVLCDQRIWEDRGTGHVVTHQLTAEDGAPSNAGNTMVLVRLEGKSEPIHITKCILNKQIVGKNILESRILMDTVYQKQQETLIVWSETDCMDLALSFQEKSGCEELWQKICEVQGRDPGDPDATFDDGDDSDIGEMSSSSSRLQLPPIEIGRLSELDAILHMHLASNSAREKMTMAIESDNVVTKLCEVFRMCEDIEHTEGLRTFYSIVKNLFMLNRNTVIEMLLDDSNIKDVIGMFEFDPAYKNPRKHREFVYEKAKFREVLNITSDELRDKIHRLYRAQYIQDACLPSLGLFEENLLSTLGSHVFFCRVDIVSMLQKDKKAMAELFGQLKSDETEVIRRRDLVLFLKEMICLSTSIPANGPAATKETFFKVLQLQSMFNNDILDSLEPSFKSPDHETRCVMTDVLRTMVDSNAQTIRDYLLKQAKNKDRNEDVLLNRMINHLLTDIDVHLTSGSEMILILKTLLDPENMTSVKSERSEFLHLFYHRCFDTLLKPMLENVSGGVIKKDDYIIANRQSVVLRLLTFCVEHHSFSMRQRCVSNDMMNKVLVLLKSKHSFLVLSALKLLQRVVTVKDDKYIRYLVKEKVLDPVMECFRKNGNRYNIVNSAVLHLFDFVKCEDVRPLIKYVVENHMEVIESVNYVKTFKEIKIRYDQHRDREETMSIRSEDNLSLASPRSSRRDRNEDQWFDEDEELEVGSMMESIEKDSVSVSPKKEESGQGRKTGIEPMFPSLLKRKNAFDEDEAPVFGGGSAAVINNAEKKIVIKVGANHNDVLETILRKPFSCSSPGPSREDEVTSSQNNKESSPTSTVKVRLYQKLCFMKNSSFQSLVDYDESDSDEELPSPDAIPSSSTGSPESDKEADAKDGKKIDSPEYNDVSSTSSEEKFDSLPNGAHVTNENGGESTVSQEISRKRTSDGCDPNDAKRSRTEDADLAANETASEA
ncbi:Protein CBR-SMK-1 [Caenorhabditis briggsae]|uniref:Protein CBR-SMK-1 n=1 Tax=Caenorhabditis briggsae TaxID=6238 RepID=A8WQL6_CAEBR|nr:Protein CBR-SMK-1 [Caenorhabditis briggsae]CAP22774.2 Protein CBR-SMK-1 [Caenorhabditis briggsae]